MSGNRLKDTAGRTLVGFALLVTLVVGAALRDWWGRADLEWTRLPTAVEDQNYYSALGDDDFSQPNLAFWAAPDGLVRLDQKPKLLRDFRMRKLIDPRSGQFTRSAAPGSVGFTRIGAAGARIPGHFVYWYDKDEIDPSSGLPSRFYLKAGDDRYIHFGAPADPTGETDSGLRDRGEPATPSAPS